MWLLRASVLRCCVYWIVLAVCSNSLAEARPLSHQLCTRADTASCNWDMVNSDFFPPQTVTSAGQEQIADARQNQVPLQSDVAAAFPGIQADVLFLILEASLDAPLGKGHQQQLAHAGFGRCVVEEEFQLLFVEHVASDEQMVRFGGQPLFVRTNQHRMFDFPNHRAFLAILDSISLPRLIAQDGVFFEQHIDPLRLGTALGQSRNVAGSTCFLSAARSDFRPFQPTGHVNGNFADKALPTRVQSPQKRAFGA